jgi:predicted phosphodiesterase
MSDTRAYVVGSGALLLAALAVPVWASCSSGQAPASPDSGTSDAPASEGGTFAGYTPSGCSYTLSPPSTFNFTNLSLDKSAAVGSASGAAPVRVRLGLGGGTKSGQAGYADPTTTAVFTWETAEQDSNAKVQIGTSMTALSAVHAGYAWTTPGSPLDSSTTNMHEVHVCGLTPGTTYYYQVGGGAAGKEVWSATQSFTTLPSTGKITVGVLSDARDTVSIWQTVHTRMKSLGVDMQIIPGDIVDIGEDESEFSQWLSAIWQSGSGFLTLGEQLMVPIAGNHENEAVQFYGNFSIPYTTTDGAYAKSYTSFNVGNAHIVMYDDTPLANGNTTEASAQQAWLKADLAAADANRSKFPFILVGSHRGLYSTSLHGNDADVLQARSVLAPLYDQYHVDLALNGHDHEYERTNVINAGAVEAPAPKGGTVDTSKGTVYVVNAGAGADPYLVGTMPVATRALNAPLCVSSAGTACADAGTATFIGCYVVLELEGSSITLTAYGITGSASSDTVIDTLTLTHP